MIILRMGDPHIRQSNIEEADKLMSFAKQIIVDRKVDRLEILGDLMHTHAVIRLEVLEFWDKWLNIFKSTVETVVLVGNHDQTGDKNSKSHSLSVFKRLQDSRLLIIDKPQQIGITGYMPYFHNNEEFIKEANSLYVNGAKTLVCHATFSGSQYDNGFYAPEGINPDDVLCHQIISGHIHKEQIIGKVDYPGTAKWDSASDANENKGLWLYEHDDITGKVLKRELISTSNIVTPIVSVQWEEGKELPILPENARISLELVGSSNWINKQKQGFKGKVSIKSKITDKERPANRKPGKGLEDFLLNVYNTNMDRTGLLSYAKELGIV